MNGSETTWRRSSLRWPSTEPPAPDLDAMRGEVVRRAGRMRARRRAIPAAGVALAAAAALALSAITGDAVSVRTVPPAGNTDPDNIAPAEASGAATPQEASADAGAGAGAGRATAARPMGAGTGASVPPKAIGGGGPAPAPAVDIAGRLAFASSRAGNLDIWVREGTALIQVTRTAAAESSPAWSPDGSQLVFVRAGDAAERAAGARTMLVVIDRDGSDERVIVRSREDLSRPAWAPDGSVIAYTSFLLTSDGGDGRHDIYTVEPDGDAAGDVLVEDAFDPAWSPNGDLAYGTRRGLEIRSPARDIIGRRLSDGIDAMPAFSPDGQTIAFFRYGERSRIGLVSVDGETLRLVTDSNEWDRSPAWAPDGRSIVFDRDPDGHEVAEPSCGVGVWDGEPKVSCLPYAHGPRPSRLMQLRVSDGRAAGDPVALADAGDDEFDPSFAR